MVTFALLSASACIFVLPRYLAGASMIHLFRIVIQG